MRSTKIILIAIVVITAIGAGAYAYSRATGVRALPRQEPPGAPNENTGTLGGTISYTEHGFEPAEFRIKQGQVVRFVNNSEVETWPASAVHPTHSVYPQHAQADCLGSSFDACRGLKLGGSWEFEFDYAGEWRFHDHLHPSNTGTIYVD